MGFFGKVGALFRGMFGATSPVTTRGAVKSVEERERVSTMPPPNDPVRQSWDRLKEFVARCDREEVDLVGLRIEDPIGFWARHSRIEIAKLTGASVEEAILAEGLSCVDHWTVVQRYFQARYSELVRMPNGKATIRYVDAFQRACEQSEQYVAKERDRLESEQRDLEPIGGVSLQRFAEISAALAHLGAEASRARTTEVLAAYGLGAATFGSVRRGWEQRMSGDKSKKLRRVYRAAWTHARELLDNGQLRLPDAADPKSATPNNGATTRYTWVESMEARPEYRSSMMTG